MLSRSISIFLLSLCCLFFSISSFSNPPIHYYISGYLPSTPDQRVLIEIREAKIQSIDISPTLVRTPYYRGLPLLFTNSYIFPGMIDLHGHLKYHVLPLWNEAKGQFKNRFEWRYKFQKYQNTVSFNMRAYKANMLCELVRYAEIKALTAGVTTIQGAQDELACASGFGIHNAEAAREWENTKGALSLSDFIIPDAIGLLFSKYLFPLLKISSKDDLINNSSEDLNKNYDNALKEWLFTSEIENWIQDFLTSRNRIDHALRLLLGPSFKIGFPISENLDSQSQLQIFEILKPEISNYITTHFQLTEKKASSFIEAIQKWIFGSSMFPQHSGFLSLSQKDRKSALFYLSRPGILHIQNPQRKYLASFEMPVRSVVDEYLHHNSSLAIFAHLAEGAPDDHYNQKEYTYALQTGLIRNKLVMIHGLGLNQKELRDAKDRGASLVWSPLSNLLLYGETLDLKQVKKSGILLALGTDWSLTGSKNLLDELKIAYNFIQSIATQPNDKKLYSAEEIVNMVTQNPAKILQQENVLGKVEAGYQADLLLVQKKNISYNLDTKSTQLEADPYLSLIQSEQSDIDVVIVSGKIAYSHLSRQTEIQTIHPESISTPGRASSKYFLYEKLNPDCPSMNGYLLKSEHGEEWEFSKISSRLEAARQQYLKNASKSGVSLPIDFIFSCEDKTYETRWNKVLTSEIFENRKNRKTLRLKQNLSDDYDPSAEADPYDDL